MARSRLPGALDSGFRGRYRRPDGSSVRKNTLVPTRRSGSERKAEWAEGLRRALLLIVVGLLPALAAAQVAIPDPDLGGVEPRVREAIESARQRVASHPTDGEAWGELGMVLEAHSLAEAAKIAYQEAYRLAPRDFRWPYFAASLFDYSDARAAVEWHQKALAIDDAYAPAHVRIGEALEKLGRSAEARSHFEVAVRLDPSNALAHLGAGRLLLREGKTEQALEHLEQAYRLAPTTQAVVATLAQALYRAGQSDRARALAQEARTLPRTRSAHDPRRAAIRDRASDLESYLRRARTALEIGRNDQARAEIEKLLAIEPDHAEAYLMLATIEDRRQRPQQAADAARRALELDPGLAKRARPMLAGALFKLGRFDEARPIVAEVLASEPNNFHALVLAAMLSGQGGDTAGLIRNLERAFEARSGDEELRRVLDRLLRDLAESFASIGEFGEAASWMERAVTLAVEAQAPASTLDRYRTQLADYRSRARSR